jgi:hypothetical protein
MKPYRFGTYIDRGRNLRALLAAGEPICLPLHHDLGDCSLQSVDSKRYRLLKFVVIDWYIYPPIVSPSVTLQDLQANAVRALWLVSLMLAAVLSVADVQERVQSTTSFVVRPDVHHL